jgi:RNA polymerase sigma factor (sigma-70 family)
VNGPLIVEEEPAFPVEARKEAFSRQAARWPAREADPAAPSPGTNGDGDRENLYAEFQPLVRRLIRQYGDDPDLRQDLPGEIFRRFCSVLDAYDPTRGIPLRPYIVCNLSSSVYTFVRSHWRRKRREVNLDPGLDAHESAAVIDPTPAVDRELQNQEVLKALPDAIALLSPRQRMVVIARFYEARSFEDIAETLRVCPATARSLLRHGLNNLRRHFARTGWD